ncbi:cytidine deaminase-like protein [Stachybotrys elegans]|uniref:Cytidine deaminase-like protein n=1 Tax=Stachybotrys elegans TaxID=80388 RepID=A0A8K0WN76_9HYPO|nr:cytidine deaminase-like protein [Stachybotrys elegans]
MSSAEPTSTELLSSLLTTIERAIIPLTRDGVSSGSKVFGAAILSRGTLAPLTVATNNERVSPLLHGEINCIQQFFTVDFPSAETRPHPRTDCVFLATHEPCSLCLSGIAWSGFREVYYLFTYEDSRDLFAIPYDIDILQEVFRVKGAETAEQMEARPLYNRSNKFFEARSFQDLVAGVEGEEEKRRWTAEIERVKGLYAGLSEVYQEGKKSGAESSSVWK